MSTFTSKRVEQASMFSKCRHWLSQRYQRSLLKALISSIVFDCREALYIRRLCTQSPDFARIHQSLKRHYLLESPYRISRRYLKVRGSNDIHTYGEIPIKALNHIAAKLAIHPTDHVLELGAGRGRAAFFLRTQFACQVTGIERIPQFVETGESIAALHHLPNIRFVCADMLEIPWPEASIIILYGTCLQDSEIKQLIQKILQLSHKASIVSTSYPLTDFYKGASITLSSSFVEPFPWGHSRIYVHQFHPKPREA